MTHTLSLDGPMFDSFTAEEKNDLREWIASLGRPAGRPPQREPLPLTGHYTAPVEPDAFSRYASERYGSLALAELADYFVHVELHPGARQAARVLLERVFGALEEALAPSTRLGAEQPPTYGEGTLASLFHVEGVRSSSTARGPYTSAVAGSRALLRGAAGVACARFEEHGWLLRRYLESAEQAQHEARAIEPSAFWRAVNEALALHPRAFLPEILGMNLALEQMEAEATELSKTYRSWATFAVHAFLGRVRESCPSAVEPAWQRTWRAYRMALMMGQGGQPEREALLERLTVASSPAEERLAMTTPAR
jgi:hypothetical protein